MFLILNRMILLEMRLRSIRFSKLRLELYYLQMILAAAPNNGEPTNGLSQGKIESTSMEKCSNEDAIKADTSLDQQLVVVSVGTSPCITAEGSGYESGSAAGGCLCWNKPRHNRRGKDNSHTTHGPSNLI
ncbi:hypothetical protein Hdeb2414_s0008g00297181 [Helianthus debilis subsp. tardiflorus]